MSNTSTVWVVFNDTHKNMSAAEKFGQLKDVFSSVAKTYNARKMIEHARRVLKDWQPGDSLLLVGDPTLCGVCMAVALEFEEKITVLKWDRINFDYNPLVLDFSFFDDEQ